MRIYGEIAVVVRAPYDDEPPEGWIAEIWQSGDHWGDVTETAEGLKVRIYPHLEGRPWQWSLEALLDVLERARGRLAALHGPAE